MVQANANVLAEIWERVRSLSAREKLSLAKRLLTSLENEGIPRPTDGDPTSIIGVLKNASHLTDEDVEKIIDEERTRKFGG
jgi:hypothetical protein